MLRRAAWSVLAIATQGIAAQEPAAAPPDEYAYRAEGRRDPFTRLLEADPQEPTSPSRPSGLAGIFVDEVSVRGVLQAGVSLIALIQGADHEAYVVHAGDRLLDGVVKAVTALGLVIVQEVNDPGSLVKQREVTKRLRSREDSK